MAGLLPDDRSPEKHKSIPGSTPKSLSKKSVTPKEGTLFSEVGRLFSSIAKFVTGQVRDTPSDGPSQFGPRAISHSKEKESLLRTAERVVGNLQQFKNELMHEFGFVSYAFIAKSIDPMIRQAAQTIQELSTKDMVEASRSILDQAVQSVNLYAQFSNEQRLRRKIMSEAMHSLRETIEKDCQILNHYRHHVLQEATALPHEASLTVLVKELEPIFQEFQELAQTSMVSDDLREFFIWKTHVDERRNELIERGFLAIDTLLRATPSPHHSDLEDDILNAEQLLEEKQEELEEEH